MTNETNKKEWWKGSGLRILVAAVVAFVVGVSVGGGSDDNVIPSPEPTVTVTETVTEVAPEPVESADESEVEEESTEAPEDLGSRVLETIDGDGTVPRVSWQVPITDIETISTNTVRVYYQEQLSDEEAQEVGRKIFSWSVTQGVEELEIVVVQDASGTDRNVYRHF